MFYETKIKSYIRVPPKQFGEDIQESVISSLNEQFDGYISNELGFVISISSVDSVGEGVIIPGDGAAHYETEFTILNFKPEMHEVVIGRITEITEFGAFLEMGPVDGMIHIGQTMDDYVTFSKSGTLTGKQSKVTIKGNDHCRARIIAISYKDLANPKIGLTMRQPWLGKVKTIEEELKKQEAKKK